MYNSDCITEYPYVYAYQYMYNFTYIYVEILCVNIHINLNIYIFIFIYIHISTYRHANRCTVPSKLTARLAAMATVSPEALSPEYRIIRIHVLTYIHTNMCRCIYATIHGYVYIHMYINQKL
jgi:hypothetical protein